MYVCIYARDALKRMADRDKENFRYSVEYAMIMHEKVSLLATTAAENPFSTNYFLWLDAGIMCLCMCVCACVRVHTHIRTLTTGARSLADFLTYTHVCFATHALSLSLCEFLSLLLSRTLSVSLSQSFAHLLLLFLSHKRPLSLLSPHPPKTHLSLAVPPKLEDADWG